MVNGKQIPARTINFSTEISSIRNISVKMPIGFALAIQAKLHARLIENKPFTISYPSDEAEAPDPMQVVLISKTISANKPATETTFEGIQDRTPAPANMQVDEGAVEKFEDGITVNLDIQFKVPGTQPFQLMPKWVKRTANRANCREQAEAYGGPDPRVASLKVSFAKINEFIKGKGGYAAYLASRIKTDPPIAEDQPQTMTRTMLLSLYGPMESELERFHATMARARNYGDSSVADALQEWRNSGAIAKQLQAFLLDAVAQAGRGKTTNNDGKGFKGGPSKGRGSGGPRHGPYGKRTKNPEPEPIWRAVSQTPSVTQSSSVGRESSTSSQFDWRPNFSSSSSSAKRTHETSSQSSLWQ
jgi:hypothetical protein